jgi:carboxyl-terminal processing protease
MKYTPLLRRYARFISVLLLLSSTDTFVAKQKKPAPAPMPIEKKFDFDEVVYNWTRTYAEVLELIKEKHYKVADLQDCMTKSIDALLNCLDPHSSFLDTKTYKSILESTTGEFFGIGIVIDNTRQPKDKFLMVIDIIPEGPADKAGVLPYDKIIEIEGTILDGMTTEEATAKLKGERNTKVTVKVLREGKTEPLNFTITRDVIKEQSSLCFYLKEHNIYYVSLSTFSDNAVRQIKELLQKSNKNSYKGLILDLRNNSGGLLSAAIDIAGIFVDKGSLVVTTKDKAGKETDRYVTLQNPVANSSLPIFILINNFTASAAEILAGCLKIHSHELAQKSKGKAQKKLMVFVVGSTSFGKGSVQEVVPVSNDCAVKITTSLYFLPNNTSVQGVGILPDFIIDRQFPPPDQVLWFNKNYGRERALPNYIKVTENEKNEDQKEESDDEDTEHKKPWASRMRKQLGQDNQFRACITLINILDTAKHYCSVKVTTRDTALDFMRANYITQDNIVMEEVKI